ncbi:hypothetical protein F5X96DRAFT_218100 [Biscogniauxia mediterranea]|nr:hypothetical protein F5X96DRAFT_218100 [Biscogniauxia mediterranea]
MDQFYFISISPFLLNIGTYLHILYIYQTYDLQTIVLRYLFFLSTRPKLPRYIYVCLYVCLSFLNLNLPYWLS